MCLTWKCPEPESNQRHEDFQSSALPTELSGHTRFRASSGGRIWTYDLRVMSPTSFQTAPPRVINLNGWRRIRTFEGGANRFTVCPLWPLGNPSIKPINGLEPLTCWLQISCSANWATSACLDNKKWDQQGSNLWPPACKAGALPAELWSREFHRLLSLVPTDLIIILYVFSNVNTFL